VKPSAASRVGTAWTCPFPRAAKRLSGTIANCFVRVPPHELGLHGPSFLGSPSAFPYKTVSSPSGGQCSRGPAPEQVGKPAGPFGTYMTAAVTPCGVWRRTRTHASDSACPHALRLLFRGKLGEATASAFGPVPQGACAPQWRDCFLGFRVPAPAIRRMNAGRRRRASGSAGVAMARPGPVSIGGQFIQGRGERRCRGGNYSLRWWEYEPLGLSHTANVPALESNRTPKKAAKSLPLPPHPAQGA